MADVDKVEDVEEEATITLQEALEEQDRREKESMAVLGASDPDHCSYSKGYMKRQALYACLTCNPKGAPFFQPAGICLACSYSCHEGHELVELFTKRHFKCDCGNKKFPDNPCRLQAEKDETNSENVYNQNFTGVYCSCHRPYPETEESETSDDPMIQCIICEDWYHFRHSLGYLNIDFETALEEDYELICGPCMQRLDFLGHYAHLTLKPKPAIIPLPSTSETAASENNEPKGNSEIDVLVDVIETEVAKNPIEDTTSQDSGVGSIAGSDNGSSEAVICQLQKRSKEALPNTGLEEVGVAWKAATRSSLCRCNNCLELYQSLKIAFLLDEEDTIEYYEALGKKKSEDVKLSAEADLNNQVNQMGHVGQMELLYGYNFLKDQLADFLKKHAENGTTVKREDVVDFFAKINEEASANKRRRLQ